MKKGKQRVNIEDPKTGKRRIGILDWLTGLVKLSDDREVKPDPNKITKF